MRGVTKNDRLRNEQIKHNVEVQPILEYMEHRELSWYGHLQRTDRNRRMKRIWFAKIRLKRETKGDF